MDKIRVVVYGVGEVGRLVARSILEKEGIEVVGAIDVDKKILGQDLKNVLNLRNSVGVIVTNDAKRVLQETKPDVVIHTTSSYLKDVFPQFQQIVGCGSNVISTCEELSYPYYSEPLLAKTLDELSRENKVTILGTGINPGFLMDTLVIALTAPCQNIKRIKAVRVMNAATRRPSFQKKIGSGLSIEEFNTAINVRKITGHVGLEQSISMIAGALKWNLDHVEVGVVKPVVADDDVSSEIIEVKKGDVAGLKQVAKGLKAGKEVITLDFQAYIGAEEEYDSIEIEGTPAIHQKITPCVHGDQGTVAMILNSIPKVINAHPGLVTMKDLPLPSATTGNMKNFVN